MSTASDAEAERGARVFVGRQRELAELETHLGSTLSGRGGVVLLGGEPGIGKTRLLDELGVRARDAGVPPLWGRCWEEGGAPAYWPWVQILRAGLRHDEPARVASVIGNQAALLGALLPELPGAAPVAGTALPATGVESEHRRFALFDAVGSFFRTIAGPRRVLVLLDDVHAADGPSLRLLAFLARELREAPVLIVVAHRLLGLRASPILTETLAESAREGVAVQLGGLPEGDVARFIEVRAGIRPASGVVTELCLQTGGNPFFLDEVVRLLVADGHLTKAGGLTGVRRGVPFRVRDTIERRLEPLTPECGTLLRAAAVIGHEFTLRQVTMVTGVEPPVVLGLLDEAVTAGIVARTGSTGGFRFVHALFREFLYDGLPDAERTALHGRVGHVLEEQTGTRTAVLLAELAHHFLEATEGGGDVDRAVLYARRAAAEAMSRLAYEEAVGLCERALEALALQAPPDAAARAELLIDLGEAHQRTGALEAARSAFRDAASLARRTEPERAGPLLARAALGFAGLGPEVGRVDGTAVALLEDALATLDPAPGTLRARLLARLASELTYAAGDTRRYELSEEAVAMAERVDDPATLGYVLTRRLVVLMEPGNVEKRRALASSILDLGQRTGDREMAAEGRGWRLFAELECGDLPGVDHDLDLLSQLAEETRHPHYRWLTAMFRAMRALLAAHFDDAERLAGDALAIGERVGDPNALVAYGAQLYVLRRGQGRLAELEPLMSGFVARHASAPVWETATALLYALLGRMDDARGRFESAFDEFTALPRDVTWLPHLGLLGEACALLGDTKRAAVLLPLLEPFAEQTLVAGPGAASFGIAMRVVGLLAATVGRYDEAAAHLDLAAHLEEQRGGLAWFAQSLCDHATVLLARHAPGDRELAARSAGRARALALRLGMQTIAATAATLARQLDDEAPRSDPGAHRQVLRREKDHWTVEYEGRACRLRDSKGMHLLVHLLRHPGEEFHAASLVAAASGAALEPDIPALDQAASERARVSVTRAVHGLLDRIATAHPALGEHLARTVHTGTVCSYAPDPRLPRTWES